MCDKLTDQLKLHVLEAERRQQAGHQAVREFVDLYAKPVYLLAAAEKSNCKPKKFKKKS